MEERIATLPARFLLRASRDPEGAGPPACVRRLRAGFWWVSRVPGVSFHVEGAAPHLPAKPGGPKFIGRQGSPGNRRFPASGSREACRQETLMDHQILRRGRVGPHLEPRLRPE